MRTRITWSARTNPVKMHLNAYRGSGVTVLGAIGAQMPKPVFTLGKNTSIETVQKFIKTLHKVMNPVKAEPWKKIVLVMDNHRAHRS